MRPQSPDAAAALGSLDSLLPELLNEILCRLPLHDAVRTSALARAWRRRWESVPSLKFEWDFQADHGAISGVLRRYSCLVCEFCHSCVPESSFRHSDRWLRLLALRGVQSLDLNFERPDDELVHALHPSIFSCRLLTVFDLRGCNIPAPPPGFAGLPNLTVLSLSCVGFPEGARVLELLIATSPLLESLCLNLLSLPYSNGGYDHWVRRPNFGAFLLMIFLYQGWQINDLPSLEEANIDCPTYSTDCDLVKLMTGLAHARKLEFVMSTRNDNVLEGLSHPFDNLKSLSLHTSLRLLSSASSLFCLLRNAPKLEVLDIELNEDYSQGDEFDSDFFNAQWTDDLFSNLIRVDVTYMTCKLSEMHFIEFVLSKARRLQEFHVCLDQRCSRSNEDAVTELAKCRRASPRAKVFFNRRQNH